MSKIRFHSHTTQQLLQLCLRLLKRKRLLVLIRKDMTIFFLLYFFTTFLHQNCQCVYIPLPHPTISTYTFLFIKITEDGTLQGLTPLRPSYVPGLGEIVFMYS